jgi:hypothetical protein
MKWEGREEEFQAGTGLCKRPGGALSVDPLLPTAGHLSLGETEAQRQAGSHLRTQVWPGPPSRVS